MKPKTYTRVHRGMVFWFDPDASYPRTTTKLMYNNREFDSHLQLGHRPWLVVSNNEGNSTSDTCNIVPITSEDKNSIPVHVKYMAKGKQQTILVEQIRTVDSLALTKYEYTLSEEIMQQVDAAIALQMGIKPEVTYKDAKMDNIVQYLETVVDSIIQEKVKVIQAQAQAEAAKVSDAQIEDAALRLGETLESLMKPSIAETPVKPTTHANDAESKPEVVSQPSVKAEEPQPKAVNNQPQQPEAVSAPRDKYAGMSPSEKFNARYHITPSVNRPSVQQSSPSTKPVKPGAKSPATTKNRWTIEARQKFLADFETLSPKEMMEKYGLSTIKSVFQTKYNHKAYLEKYNNGGETHNDT